MKQLIKQCYSPYIKLTILHLHVLGRVNWSGLGRVNWRTWTSELGELGRVNWAIHEDEKRPEMRRRWEYHITSRFTSRFAEFHEISRADRRNFTSRFGGISLSFHERIRLDLDMGWIWTWRVNWTWTGLGRELTLSSGAKSFNFGDCFYGGG